MVSNMSAAWLISVGTEAANLVSFISLVLWCIFYSWIITFQDIYSCFRRIFQFFSYLLLDSWKSSCHLSSEINVEHEVSTSKLPCIISREDIEIVMENLGLYREMKEHNRSLEPLQDSFEFANVFNEKEPCLDEVRQAFGLFDENNDGFIDAEELNKVMNSIGLTGFSEQECKRMIMAFDDNGDGRVDFGEFVKLLEECFC